MIRTWSRCKGGDYRAFKRIVFRYQDRIYNLCLHMLRDAEEAQDVFIKAYGGLEGLQAGLVVPHVALSGRGQRLS